MSANHAHKWEQSYQTNKPKEKQVRVVRKTSWITKGEKILYSIIGVCLIAAGIYMVSFSSSTDSLNRDLQSLERTVKQQEVVNEGYRYEKKELSRPERITSIAKKHGLKIQDAEVKQASALNN
ncbi:cell division protein FtsL [Virgibacillus dakarensis]|uniref:Cell division protein FtsL n=1 Tax=Lentibacillus populi TaxID=1827502 RepID=A0A9W5X632_9BACI|nr:MULTISPECIES: cell division protein FtsL [Bacillaceae]MBT2216942.1 cell division protein FtsL [Virgibacillus dakarensis]MTW85348.1 cell division protein FtsL [Virgibacillus dakarensis]GGB45113.1 cell division protein FtsL [Lentibacillus populi]